MSKSLRFIYLPFLLIVLISGVVKAQATFQSDKELKKQAEKLFDEGKFVEAYPIYSQLLIRSPKNYDYNYRLGVCTLFSVSDKEQAIPFLEFAVNSPEVEKEVTFYLGKAYLLSYRFEDAIVKFNAYKQKASPKDIQKLEVDMQIEMCKNGTKLIRNITDWVIVDKKELSENNFFLSYELAPEVGKLLVKPNDASFKSELDIKKNETSLIYPGDR